MVYLPNELIINIYEYLECEEIIKSIELFPFLDKLAKNRIDYNYPYRLWHSASEKGNIAMLNWLKFNKIKGCLDSMNLAARNGHLEAVIWFHNNNKRCTKAAMDYAAMNGHLDIVKFLHNNRTEGCSWAMHAAAVNGHLEIVKFLHDKYPTNSGYRRSTMDYVAENGHLEVLKWLHYNRIEGCTKDAMNMAAKNGNTEIVIFLCENRRQSKTNVKNAISWAEQESNVDIVNYLKSKFKI